MEEVAVGRELAVAGESRPGEVQAGNTSAFSKSQGPARVSVRSR